MDPPGASTSSRKGKEKKKPCNLPDPTIPPQGTRWTTVADGVRAGNLNTSYFNYLFVKTALETRMMAVNHTPEILVFIKILDIIQADYRRFIDGIQEEIDVLNYKLD
ncbi:hypothetical protein L873DRAFT_1788411 [Choiromyces venosus 120613-1]|uniref:Uncharacterized protein n=1 Tax=Choiromyces venosus 120613-1 TaxID=1336337 RepID=A0A3N4JZ14_9PEZI|nr:hypothetical protein L873DRAFT_1788411 [Choiromyces venosus 120613-1]